MLRPSFRHLNIARARVIKNDELFSPRLMISRTINTSSSGFTPESTSSDPITVSTYMNYVKDDTAPASSSAVLPKLPERLDRLLYHDEKNPELERAPVTVTDLRGFQNELDLDKQGFVVREVGAAKLFDFDTDEGIRKTWIPEVDRLLKEITGASTIVSYDYHIRRYSLQKTLSALKNDPYTADDANNPTLYINDGPGYNGVDILGPIRRVHIDDHPEGMSNLMKAYLTPEDFSAYSSRPVITINTWHPLKTIRKDPLAVLDQRTLRAEERVTDMYQVAGLDIPNYSIRKPSANHRHGWYFAKDLTPQEVLMFKMVDTREGHEDFMGVAHSSFVDPENEHDNEDRESIEVRSFCFF